MCLARKTRLGIFLVALICVSALFLVPPRAFAEYPDKPITILVAFAAGGSVDTTVRALAAGAEKILGQPVIIENRPGGGGSVALAVLKGASPDGYTLAGATSTAIVRVPQRRKVPYFPLKSFTPIFAYAQPPSAVVVKTDAPWKTFKELVEYARKNPGKVKYSTAGAGSFMHMAMEMVKVQEGIRWIHIPYKGTMPALTALLGGHVDACSAGPQFVGMVKSGKVRILAVQTKERMEEFPDVPAFPELGYSWYNNTLFSIFGPAGMAPEIVKKLEATFMKVAQTEKFKKILKQYAMVITNLGSKEYKDFLEKSWPEETEVLKKLGLIKKPATSPR
ncbi:MAG: tripartite tricarboxylate transporter substrate binding protein [Deltaproteobacteria bacterium]|nr:tripartite tricarboxylate transporter substrate binding protein [Deltaproteobacteria bacterium]MBW1947187.1 tripartite tricarboxylate transporter substrate binding protein [Deltaproteobacteria bacterium]MBW2305086.1 tripartite tricarboxylate transporter substrate binding protein [Deltaproteobacteria bacterium]